MSDRYSLDHWQREARALKERTFRPSSSTCPHRCEGQIRHQGRGVLTRCPNQCGLGESKHEIHLCGPCAHRIKRGLQAPP